MDTPAPETMLLTYKFRLNPERRQHRALERILEQQRQLYNAALQERIECYRKTGKSLNDIAQSKSLTQIRADDPAFAGVQRRIQRETLRRLDRAYKAFFRRAKQGAGAASGFPQFRGRDYFDGFGFDAFCQIKFADGGLWFSGMPGKLRVHVDRPLPAGPDGTPDIRNVWFKRSGAKWYAGLQIAAPLDAHRDGRGTEAIGADWGTSVLAALSTGEMIPNPRHGEALAADLTRAQRAVARKRKGSRARLKARRHLQAVQRQIANRRRNTLDKVSKRLVTHFGLLAIENIDVKALMNAERAGEPVPQFVKTRRNREALDAAPYLLRQMLTYKAKRYGAEIVAVDPTAKCAHDNNPLAPTQRCSYCGGLHFKELAEAVHTCTTPGPFFSKSLPRKVNAARVIRIAALETWPLAGHPRGGPVPGGLDGGGNTAAARNAGTGSRRLGNTEKEQSSPGRRAGHPALPIAHAQKDRAKDPRLRGSA